MEGRDGNVPDLDSGSGYTTVYTSILAELYTKKTVHFRIERFGKVFL